MNKAFCADILRSVKKGRKRFFSILIITALGVGMMTGLYASGLSMYYSADRFFDDQNLFDIQILSPFGLTEEDVDILSRVEGVETVEGGYGETVYTEIPGARKKADITVLGGGINVPRLIFGALPEKADEIAVTQKYLDESGKSVGDTLTVKGNLNVNAEYIITGVVLDPKDIRGNEKNGIVRTALTADYGFFIAETAADNNIFSVIYIILTGTKKMNSYSDEYKEKVQTVIDDIEGGIASGWYIRDRTSLESYSALNSDLSSIETVGRIFPVIFLLVAVLMSLTAMTRMVEEERTLIGTYKSLGYGNAAVYSKYILFAVTACLLGGALGDVFGFVFMPRFISEVLSSLYSLPHYYLRFDPLYGIGSVLLFTVFVTAATALSCRGELRSDPAALLRPKAPRSGSRVWLERIPALWNRLKFLNKVTIRNLFRYKKRFFMTIGGIMGCTALIVCGFAIRDSVTRLSPNQYGNIYKYDLLAVFEENGYEDTVRRMTDIEDYTGLRVEGVKLINSGGESNSVQLMVIPDGSSIEDYIRMENSDGTPLYPDNGGVLITQNAARILGIKPGDTVSLQNMKLDRGTAAVSGVVKNYLGNNVYMTQKLYESLFGAYLPNAVLANLSGNADHAAYAEALISDGFALSAASTRTLREDFSFDLLGAIVMLLIGLAGGLALAVLFTLSATNISERVRELATVKVLGFYDKEVHQYLNKETLILTAIGILAGLPAGRILSEVLVASLNMPSIHFEVYISPVSYLISAAITFAFALMVNLITNRTLDRIDMVEALKSAE